MNATERAASRDGALFFEDLIEADGQRTLRILDQRKIGDSSQAGAG